MLGLIFSIYLALTILMCFARIKIGISMYLFYSILVPYLHFFSFGQNLFSFLIIISLFYTYGYKTITFRPFIPFLFLYITQFLLIPFHSDVPVEIQLNFFRIDFMSSLLLPFAMINVMKHDPKSLSLFNKTIIVSIVIAVLYSLFLVTISGINPYIMILKPLLTEQGYDVSLYNSYYAAEGEGRLFGRISGVFMHPMTNGVFLCIALIYILFKILNVKKNRKKKVMFSILFLIIFMTIFFIGVRSAIGATILGLGLFILMERKFKLILYVLVGGGLLFIIFKQIPGMEDLITSIFDSKSSNVSGSSIDMRISQFNGALNEIKNNLLFGKGYGWTDYYKGLHGDHPILLAFESLVFIVLCDNGFVGIGIWIIMIILYYNIVKKHFKSNFSHIMLLLIATYIIYSVMTGEYGYMKYFLIFYSIMWMYGEKKTNGYLKKW
jgi:O-antigen ligase